MADADSDYATTTELKALMGITDSASDALLASLITRVSRDIDGYFGRRFYTPTADETRVYDVPTGDRGDLWFDEDVYSLTSITNSDGVAVPATDYVLLPANKTPKFMLRLKSNRGTTWKPASSGDVLQTISVVGKWGYASSAPPEIKRLALAVAAGRWTQRADGGLVRSKSIGDYSVSYGVSTAGSGDIETLAADLGHLVKRHFA